jgi:hypothetical protein
MFEACLCVDPDDVYRALVEYEIRVVDTPVECTECGEAILVGEEYEHFEGTLDDIDALEEGEEPDVDVWTTCLTCVAVRDSLFVCGWIFGEMWQRIHGLYCGWDHVNTPHEWGCDPEECEGCEGPDDGTTCCRDAGCEHACVCPESRHA